jgi:ABC-type multidrug transport system fused ATPase/permease subunit
MPISPASRRPTTLWRILAYLRPSWPLCAASLTLTLIVSAMGQIPQLANRYLIDHVLVAQTRVDHALRVLVIVAIGLFLLRLVSAGLSFLRNYATRIVGQRLIYDLRRDLYRQVQYLSADFYIHTGVGQIMSRVMNDTTTIQNFVTSNLNQMLDQLFTFTTSLAIMQHFDPHLTDALLLFGPPIAGSIALFSSRLRRMNREIRRHTARLTTALHDALAGFITVKAFAAEEHVIAAFEGENLSLFGRTLSLMRLQAAFTNTMGLVTGSSAAFFLLFGGWQVVRGTLSLGTYFYVNSTRNNLFLPFTSFATLTASYQQAAAGAERIFEYLDLEPSVRDRPGARALPPVRGAIAFDRVTFRYPPAPEESEVSALGRPEGYSAPGPVGLFRRGAGAVAAPEVPAPEPAPPGQPEVEEQVEAEGGAAELPPPAALRDVSFRVEPGETVGLVGPSGGGKSTVASLIARFYDCSEGAVRVDGHDVRDVTMRSLRAQVAVVLQDVYLFRGTIRDNVAFGRAAATAEVDAALRAANAHFAWDLPEGPETIIGEGGLRLSGGQRQRVAIARALLRRPRILVLDEATSAQDTLSEDAVMQTLRERAGEMTILVIAHRLSTITHADRILVLDRGALVEQGRHLDLLAAGGLYARLYGAQAAAGEVAELGGEP